MDLTKGVPVSLKLSTKVIQNNETEDFYFELLGQVIKMGDTLYIRYKEEQADSGTDVPVTIKIAPDGKITLIRAGEPRMRLKFAYQETLESTYQTPYGLFKIATFTHNLRFSLKDQPLSGEVVIDYDLLNGAEKIGEYHLKLEFTT